MSILSLGRLTSTARLAALRHQIEEQAERRDPKKRAQALVQAAPPLEPDETQDEEPTSVVLRRLIGGVS